MIWSVDWPLGMLMALSCDWATTTVAKSATAADQKRMLCLTGCLFVVGGVRLGSQLGSCKY